MKFFLIIFLFSLIIGCRTAEEVESKPKTRDGVFSHFKDSIDQSKAVGERVNKHDQENEEQLNETDNE